MTQDKKKMWQMIGGSFGALLLAIIGFIYALGGQATAIDTNTERIKRVEYTIEKRLDRVETILYEILQEAKK